MTDHVAVLRELRRRVALNTPGVARALDHAIAAVAERDALVARLGELRDFLHGHEHGDQCPFWNPNGTETDCTCGLLDARAKADDLARVVKENNDES